HRRHSDSEQTRKQLEVLRTTAHKLLEDFTEDLQTVDPLIQTVHEHVLNARMLPLRVLFDQLPRFVRDCSRRENKSVELIIEGEQTRVDRHVLEKLRDPIIHLIRNAISHGIEPAEERTRTGKPAVGRVRLVSQQCGDRIRIVCEDDGRGIDHKRIVERALERGLISQADVHRLTQAQIERLLLQPGFSTASSVNELSGRGVGLDVVAQHVGELRGSLHIESEPNRLTRFVLDVPASVATLEGLLVEVGEYVYVIPTSAVVRTVRVRPSDVLRGAGGETLFRWETQALPLLSLASLLGWVRSTEWGPETTVRPAVTVDYRGQAVALLVDRLLGTQTVVAKALGQHLGRVSGISGATILGSGTPALILDPAELIARCRGSAGGTASVSTEEERPKLHPVLVVDDSLTTRMMEKSILESAGYEVD
ncbi:MAG TPA: hypothetical protein EYP14_08725, partial [Planctomycetaceae bacterium]|nr:hypothetical protein [Planctomycetaceae bacterium]